MSMNNYPDNIMDSANNPNSPLYAGVLLDCSHLDIDDCECWCVECGENNENCLCKMTELTKSWK